MRSPNIKYVNQTNFYLHFYFRFLNLKTIKAIAPPSVPIIIETIGAMITWFEALSNEL